MNENEEMVNLNKGSTDQSASNPITQSSGLTTAATSTPAPFQNQFPQSFKILNRPPSDKKLNEMQQNQNQSKYILIKVFFFISINLLSFYQTVHHNK